MKKQFRIYGLLAVATLLGCASGAFAQVTCATVTCASVTYDGGTTAAVETAAGTVDYTVLSTDYVDSLSTASESTTPYDAFQQSVSSLDSAADGTMFGPPNANLLNPSGANYDLYNTILGVSNTQQVYEYAAAIGNMMITCDSGGSCPYTESDFQDAVWLLFDPGDLIGDYTSDTDVATIINTIYNDEVEVGGQYVIPTSMYSNALVLSPCFGTGCGGSGVEDPACASGGAIVGGQCGTQELLAFAPTSPVVSAPESSEPLMLGADLLGLIGIAFVFRRRLIRVKN